MKNLWKFLVDSWECVRLAWRSRALEVARVSDYAGVSVQAARMVQRLRDRYPGRNFVWTFATNHVLDSRSSYVCLWEVTEEEVPPGPRAKFLVMESVGSPAFDRFVASVVTREEREESLGVSVESDRLVIRLDRPSVTCGACGEEAFSGEDLRDLVMRWGRDECGMVKAMFERSLHTMLFKKPVWEGEGSYDRPRIVAVGGESAPACARCSVEINEIEASFRADQAARADVWRAQEKDALGRLAEKVLARAAFKKQTDQEDRC